MENPTFTQQILESAQMAQELMNESNGVPTSHFLDMSRINADYENHDIYDMTLLPFILFSLMQQGLGMCFAWVGLTQGPHGINYGTKADSRGDYFQDSVSVSADDVQRTRMVLRCAIASCLNMIISAIKEREA